MRVTVLLLPVIAELNEFFSVIKPKNLFHGPNSKPFSHAFETELSSLLRR